MTAETTDARPDPHDSHFQPVSWCAKCKAEQAEIEAEREREHDAEIVRLVGEFATHTDEAIRAASLALGAVDNLTSNRVYDIEMAEGSDGPDAREALQAALFSLRSVRRIADWRKQLLGETAPVPAGQS